jgi:hypothetical protein
MSDEQSSSQRLQSATSGATREDTAVELVRSSCSPDIDSSHRSATREGTQSEEGDKNAFCRDGVLVAMARAVRP